MSHAYDAPSSLLLAVEAARKIKSAPEKSVNSRSRYRTFSDAFSALTSWFAALRMYLSALTISSTASRFALACCRRCCRLMNFCASISAIHRYGYFEDPTKHPEVKIAIRKINRKLGTRFKQARPINRHLLDRMLHVCGDDLRGIRDRMILLLAYTTLRRRSELTSMRVRIWHCVATSEPSSS